MQEFCDKFKQIATFSAVFPAKRTKKSSRSCPGASVAVLEGMDTLKTHMKIDDVIQFCFFKGVVVCKQCFHIAMYVYRLDGFLVAYFVGQALVVANSEPRLLAVRGVEFEDEMELKVRAKDSRDEKPEQVASCQRTRRTDRPLLRLLRSTST